MSGSRVPYHLRQNKHVERELFVEMLSHLNRALPIASYLYVGFGGVFFEDFKILHSRLDLNHQLSLENQEWVYARQKFNQPLSYISCKPFSSGDFIARYDDIRNENPAAKHLLCWLDYADADGVRSQLGEFQSLLPKLKHNDVIKITVNANVATLGAAVPRQSVGQLRGLRCESLRRKLGELLAEGVSEDDMTQARFPLILLKTIESLVGRAMTESPGLVFQPLSSYQYADSPHTMLTTTGIVLKARKVASFLRRTGLNTWPFAGLKWQLVKINVPYLSPIEKLRLDQQLQAIDGDPKPLGFLFDKTEEKSKEMVSQYSKFQRFYPHYHRISY